MINGPNTLVPFRKILFLLDDTPCRAALCECLAQRDFSLERVGSVEDAIACWHAEPESLIFVGEAFASEMLDRIEPGQGLAVVVVSCDVGTQSGEAWLAAGACDFLPLELIDADRVQRVVRHAAQWRLAGELQRRQHGAEFDSTSYLAKTLAHNLTQPVIEASDDAIFLETPDGVIQTWNAGAERLYGYSLDEAVGRPFWFLLPPERLGERDIILQSVARGECVFNFETVRRRKDGSLVDVSLTVTPLFDEQGRITGAAAVARDVSAQKHSENLYRILAANFPNGSVYFINSAERILLAEGRGLAQIGLSPEIAGKTTGEVFGGTPFGSYLRDALGRALHGKEWAFDVEVNGRLRTVRTVPVKSESGINSMVVMTQDITEQRRAEEALRDSETRLKIALSASRMGVWEWDVNGDTLFWSPECQQIYGTEGFAGNRAAFTQYLFPEDVVRVQAAFNVALRDGTLYSEEFRIRRPDGSTRWVANMGMTRYDEAGRPVRMVGTVRDVTAEKDAQAAFAESREHLRVALESGNIGLWEWDVEHDKVHYSPQWKSQLGYAEDEISNSLEEWASRLHPGEKEGVVARVNAMIASDTSNYNVEFRLRHKDGSYRWMLAHGTIFRQTNGEAMRILGSHVDITSLKNTEAELIRSRSALQDSHDELERRVAERTAALQQANQTLRIEAVERQMVMGALRGLVGKLEEANREIENANAELIANEARLLRGNVVFTELTRLRAGTEEELQAAFAHITSAGSELLGVERCSVWLFDSDCNRLRCADLYEAGKTSHSQGLELEVEKYPRYFEALRTRRAILADEAHVHPATREFSKEYLTPLGISSMLDTPIIIGGQMAGVLCSEHVGLARHWKTEEQTLAAATAALCSLAMESFERARAENALRQSMTEAQIARAEAERANLAKSEFLSRMSHELRTPMNSILGFAQLMEMNATDEKEIERVSYILKAGRHLLHLINEVLDLARIESGKLSLSPEPVSVMATIRLAVDMIRPLIQQRELQLVEEYDPSLDYYVIADQQRLSQVLLNLLSNAMKYNRKGGQVRVGCECRADSVVRISVSDTGSGIAPQHLARLFQPFERLGAEGGVIEGTGLGLALSRYLVEAMNGKIGLETKPGQGSTFWVELLLTERKTISESTGTEAICDNDLTARNCTILYIEDNLANYQIIEHVLESYPNIHLISAMQGKLGLELAHEHKPALILLDLHLPDISGEDVLRRLLADPATCNTPVVIISADATPNQVRRLLLTGASEYLTKPLDIRRFVEVLCEHLT